MNNQQQQQQQQFQHQNMQQSGSGLTRYRSAPSSYFASYLNEGTSGLFGTEDLEQLFNLTPRPTSPDTFSRFGSDTFQHEKPRLSNTTTTTVQLQTQSHSQLPPRNDKPPLQPQKQKLHRQQSNDYSMMYQNISSESASVVDNSYGKHMSSMPMKMESGGGNSGLMRHNSSPAGLFANIDIEKELGALRNFGASNITNTSRFNNKNDFSSGMMMPPISETGSKENTSDHAGNEGDFMSGNFPVNSWDDSEILSDNFLAGIDDTDNKVQFPNDQSNEGGGKPQRTMLSHHLSLPKSSAELSAMEKLLQDSVPCKIRAKRGCATHPRSIAERVRRTKISERMRKLQELVPNMEKQTNTSDMLDLAVDFIKDLQRQVKTLSDTSAKCSCTAREKL